LSRGLLKDVSHRRTYCAKNNDGRVVGSPVTVMERRALWECVTH